jgi:GntR family transcriptional regulator
MYIVCVQYTMNENAPILRVDIDSNIPLYQQVARGIRRELVSGRLPPGHQLPSVRELAFGLGIHHNTVAEAYRLLAEEGWLDLRRGRGATVIERTHPAPNEETKAEFEGRMHELVAEAIARGVPRCGVAGVLGKLARLFEEEK